MAKIGKWKKEKMVNEIINRKFKDKKEAIESKIAFRCEELIMEELKGIPTKACDKFIRKSKYVYLSDTEYKYRGRSDTFYLSKEMPYPARDNWHFNVENDPILKKLFKQHFLLKDKVSESKDILWSVMNSCNTTKQLIDTLPEIEPIMKDLFDDRSEVSLVAVETVSKARAILS